MQGIARVDEHRLKKRYTALLVFFALCFTVLIVRLFVLQVIKHEEYLAKARDNIESETPLKAERGIIYDRNMRPLAVNVTTWRIYVSPRDVKDEYEAEKIAAGLSDIFSLDYDNLLKGVKNRSTRDKTVKNSVSEEKKDEVIAFVLEENLTHAVHVEASVSRYYPYGDLAASVIGFVGTDGGLLGIESYYDSYLKGVDGKYITYKNATGKGMANSIDTYIKATPGNDIVLTIDITLQALLEAQLKETYIDSKAQNKVTGVALDPETGEVLAMATYPSFDLNTPFELNDYYKDKLALTGYVQGSEEYKKAYNNFLYEMWNNKSVSVLYEPGSTFKIITTSVALQEKVSTVNEGFFCSGALKIDGYGSPIKCHKRQGHGSLNFAEALQKSCNPTMIKLAQRIGNTRFMDYFESFGYTGKTGIDLPGEAMGIFHSREGFNNVELSVYAFGQTFKTTPLQQISAVSAVANGGELLTPFVVKKIVSHNGETVFSGEVKTKGRVISAQVCKAITDILIGGVDGDGGGKNAGVSGYKIAAKTGTSQKRDIKDANLYVGSCVAYSVNEQASISVIIAVDEPMCANYYGSTVAAPYVSAFLSGALPYLGVPPSYTEEQAAKLNATVGDYVGLSLSEAKKLIKSLSVDVEIIGDGDSIISQVPKSGAVITKSGGKIILYTGGKEKKVAAVPKVVGLTASEAIEKLINAGFNVRLVGATDYEKGVGATVISQDLLATEAEKGSVITLTIRYLDVRE